MIFRLRDYILYPLAIKHFHDMLMESQYWSPEKRRGWLQEHLEKVLRHAIKHVPYYKRTLAPYESRFNDIIDRLDMTELPLIGKETVREYYKELHTDNIKYSHTNVTHTSGSTGTPTQFLLDKNSHISHFASIWRVLNWAGYRFGDRFADLTAEHFPKDNRLSEYDIRLNCLHLSTLNLKKEYIPTYREKLRKFNPVLIKAYPSALDLFCRWLKEIGLNNYQPKAVLTCAESLFDHQKTTIEETLKCPAFDFYNQNERAALISTCEKHTYHIHEEYSLVEMVKPHNNTKVSNEMREIVATTLHNFAMPLIRYRTNDLATLDGNALCQCGRTYKKVKKIIGRIEDAIITSGGRYVVGLFDALKYSPGIRLSQIVQHTVNEIQVNIVKANCYSKKDEYNLERELRARLGDEIDIKFNFVDSIPPGKNGKHKFVVSKLSKT